MKNKIYKKKVFFKLNEYSLLNNWLKNNIKINDGKNLKTEEDGMKVAPAKLSYSILPKIKNPKNIANVEKERSKIFLIFKKNNK